MVEYKIRIERTKKQIKKNILLHNFEAALAMISSLADSLYYSNQYYTDNDLENYLLIIQEQLKPDLKHCIEEKDQARKNTVLFYDGFGLNQRGLAYIYLHALSRFGYRLVYVVNKNLISNIPDIVALIDSCGGRIEGIDCSACCTHYKKLYELFYRYNPFSAFLYTTPYDVAGVMAFNQMKGVVNRYQINLTDHAFWLGVNAFDYCLEFRNYGACLSHQYRGIALEKLLYQPFYPVINTNISFQGFPFEKKDGNFVLFSGGFLYKTIDDDLIYYRIIEYLLLKYPQIVFWYAGYGNNKELEPLRDLLSKFPQRVFYTVERKDLFQILENVDMYINTYPVGGGLMIQYSAMAGKPPFSFSKTGNNCDILFGVNTLQVEATDIDEFVRFIDDYMNKRAYQGEYIERLKSSVISAKEFTENLWCIMTKRISAYAVSMDDISGILQMEQRDFWQRFVSRYSNIDEQ